MIRTVVSNEHGIGFPHPTMVPGISAPPPTEDSDEVVDCCLGREGGLLNLAPFSHSLLLLLLSLTGEFPLTTLEEEELHTLPIIALNQLSCTLKGSIVRVSVTVSVVLLLLLSAFMLAGYLLDGTFHTSITQKSCPHFFLAIFGASYCV